MKKTVATASVLMVIAISHNTSAEEADTTATGTSIVELNKEIEQLKESYSTAELLTAINPPKRESKSRLHGNLGTNVEVELVKRDDGVNEGKVKYTLAQGSFGMTTYQGGTLDFIREEKNCSMEICSVLTTTAASTQYKRSGRISRLILNEEI